VTSELVPLFLATLTLEHVKQPYVWCRLLPEGVGGSEKMITLYDEAHGIVVSC
jgi:hypothetical protein